MWSIFVLRRQQAEKLQGYLGNMPTMEEHYGLKEQVTDLHTQCTVLSEQLKEKDDDFEKLRDRLKEKVSLWRSTIINV